MRVCPFLFSLLATFAVCVAGAQKALVQDTHLLEKKAKLEELVSQRLQSMIATTLDKNAFAVSVQVSLQEIKKSKNKPAEPSKDKADQFALPLDMTVGLVDADAVIRKYEEEIKSLQETQNLRTERALAELKEPEYTIKNMQVFVGVSESLGQKYASELQDWVKKTLAKNAGVQAEVQVSLVKEAPDKKPLDWFDRIAKVQNLLGLFLLALTFIALLLLNKFISSKDSQASRHLTAQMQQNVKMIDAEKPKEDLIAGALDAPPEKPSDLDPIALEKLRDLRTKIVYSAIENLDKLNEIFHLWLESGEIGYQKAAFLMDILISISGNNNLSGKGFQLQWDMLIPVAARRKMRNIFNKMNEFDMQQRTALLELVAWDLISLKTLGVDFLTEPFQFVSAIPVADIQNLLQQQTPQMKTLTVMHMNEVTRDQYLQTLSVDHKREMIEQSLQMDKVLLTDITTASETLKYEVKKSENTDINTVSVQSLAPVLLSSVGILDEMQLIKDISRRNSSAGLALKSSYPTLAFIHEWPESKIKLIVSQATGDEILTLLRILPECKDKLLPLCAPRVQTIVNDDLAKSDTMDSSSKEKHLNALKLKMLQALNKGTINLPEIFPSKDQKPSGGLRAAS